MFHHVKELQFNARVSGPDARFARMLLNQFGGPNSELKAALQYFVQAFGCRAAFPDKYDMLMDIASEEFSHLEIVGATITMLCEGIQGEMKNTEERFNWMKLMSNQNEREQLIQEAFAAPHMFIEASGGGPMPTDSMGVPFSGSFINANGDLTVDLRSNIGAESRAKIVYENLLQFTDDPYVRETLIFLMTREISHFQMFTAALESIQPNFPPGVLQGDPRYTHTYFNLSNGEEVRGPWNQGQGPWPKGDEWVYIADPIVTVDQTRGLLDQGIEGTSQTQETVEKMNHQLSRQRSEEIVAAMPPGSAVQWSVYSGEDAED